MNSWQSYPKIFAMGHNAIAELLFDDVVAEEKLDGSQFSFLYFNNELKIRSKGVEMPIDAPKKMFTKAVETVKKLAPILHEGWTYRAEFLAKPHHNTLVYDRIPKDNLIIFDINTDNEQYLTYEEKKAEADRLGLETVPLLYYGKIESAEGVLKFLELTSVLGGQKIEGVVIKNYKRYSGDGKALMGKYVSEAFKEVHKKSWRESNPHGNDIILNLVNMLKTPARWNKAIQHLSERGELENSPKDIGKLLIEAKEDIRTECADLIKDELYKWAIDKVLRGATKGMPEWYKEKLLNNQFK
jgi:hypothetical protein